MINLPILVDLTGDPISIERKRYKSGFLISLIVKWKNHGKWAEDG